MSIPGDYLERLYAGFIGKNVGIRLGAPVEPAIWTYERIHEVYGEISAYLKPYRNFAADDDANGPVFFSRPLFERGFSLGPDFAFEPASVERAWLDYSREGVGMFWWGGYGRSTEHTAYLNMRSGIHAPESGSIARNGRTVAEQIGGQIFADSWGLVWPGRPDRAAGYAEIAASVSHDGEALQGARFIAACIAAAFSQPVGGDVRAVVEAGRATLRAGSTYDRVARAVMAFHDKRPHDWRACMEYLLAEWGYDRYPGACHIIPNAGVCVLALLYGDDFCRTVEIATMCGWDTDCNAGNVGSIAGVLYGIDAIPAKYRGPINDSIVLSGVSGSLNVLDIPSFSRKLAAAGYRLAGQRPPEGLAAALESGDGESALHFDFVLPGSTHGMRVSDPVPFAVAHRDLPVRSGEDSGAGGSEGTRGVLEFRFERIEREMAGRLFYKPFYRRSDFDDERYSPTFAPTARPGMKARIAFSMERWEGERIGVSGYVRETRDGKIMTTTAPFFPVPGEEHVVEFELPEVGGSQIDEVGIELTGYSGAKKRDSGRLLVTSFDLWGKARYAIDIAKQVVEFGCVTPFSHDKGCWTIEGNRMQLMSHEKCASYTGGHAVIDQRVSASVTPLAGESHLLVARASGAMRGYWGGFDGEARASILRNDFGLSCIASAPFAWERGREYRLSLEAKGSDIALFVDGQRVVEARDDSCAAGMVGCAAAEAARALYGDFLVEEL
jgi:ADP-ribosylglycohydrolase